MTKKMQARSLRPGMMIDTDAGPAEIADIYVSPGNIWAERGAVVVTLSEAFHNITFTLRPQQRIGVVQ